MAVGRPKADVVLNAEERAQFSALASSRSLPHAMVARARLVLWAAEGKSNGAIAQRLGWKHADRRPMSPALRRPALFGLQPHRSKSFKLDRYGG